MKKNYTLNDLQGACKINKRIGTLLQLDHGRDDILIRDINGNYHALHMTLKHTGKMDGMESISTSVTTNPICQKRMRDPDSICAHCFAQAMIDDRYHNMEIALERNAWLRSVLIDPAWVPMINTAFFRLESFGDLATPIQAANYVRIAMGNTQTRFALWTKNYSLFEKGLKLLGLSEKPCNLSLVISSPYLNKTLDVAQYPLADHVFTVFSAEFALEHNVNITCGDRKCLHCLSCYTGSNPYVNEILKEDSARYYKAIGKTFTGRR